TNDTPLYLSEEDGMRSFRLNGLQRQPTRVCGAMRIPLLLALTSIGFMEPAQGREPPCFLTTIQIQEMFFAVRHQAWTQCDCTNAQSARSFARCYRQAVRQLGTDQGLPEGCIRDLSTRMVVRSTCGRPKAVVCCTTKRVSGEFPDFCSVRESAKRCVAPTA